jgi:hypothetical protein
MYIFSAKVCYAPALIRNKHHTSKKQLPKYYLRTPNEKIKEQVVRLSGYITKKNHPLIS